MSATKNNSSVLTTPEANREDVVGLHIMYDPSGEAAGLCLKLMGVKGKQLIQSKRSHLLHPFLLQYRTLVHFQRQAFQNPLRNDLLYRSHQSSHGVI